MSSGERIIENLAISTRFQFFCQFFNTFFAIYLKFSSAFVSTRFQLFFAIDADRDGNNNHIVSYETHGLVSKLALSILLNGGS